LDALLCKVGLLRGSKQHPLAGKIRIKHVHRYAPRLKDMVGEIGTGADKQLVRVVKVYYQGEWYAFLSNQLDAAALPAAHMVALYLQRWRIEDAFNITKRLLGLAYFWTSSERGVELQIWATWILFVILVDLTDDVAAVLNRPFASLSMEMVYRGLYYFGQAYQRGEAQDPIMYLAENAGWLGLIKSRRKQPAFLFPSLTNRSGP
jgi:hypothetical protein